MMLFKSWNSKKKQTKPFLLLSMWSCELDLIVVVIVVVVMVLCITASDSVSAADWTIYVDNIIANESINAIGNTENINKTCILKYREYDFDLAKDDVTHSTELAICTNYRAEIYNNNNNKNSNNNNKNNFKNCNEREILANNVVPILSNTQTVPFAEWHLIQKTIYNTEGELYVTINVTKHKTIKLVVYIGASSDLFCYTASLYTNKVANHNTSIFSPAKKKHSVLTISARSSENTNANSERNVITEAITTNCDSAYINKMIVIEKDTTRSNSTNDKHDTNKYTIVEDAMINETKISLFQHQSANAIWLPSSLAPSCERQLSRYLQSQTNYTPSSYETLLMDDGSFSYHYHFDTNNINETFTRKDNIENSVTKEMHFAEKPPCLLARVDRFEHVINLPEQKVNNNNNINDDDNDSIINCWYNYGSDEASTNTNDYYPNTTYNSLHCRFTVSATMHILDKVVTEADINKVRDVFALKFTATVLPVVSEEYSENSCTNVSISPEFWQIVYENTTNTSDNAVCVDVSWLQHKQVDDGLWLTSWLLLINISILVFIIMIVLRVYLMK